MPAADRPRLPLVATPENRDSSNAKDSKLVNCYVEKQDDDTYQVVKRPGLLRVYDLTSGAGLGIFNWSNDVYAVKGNTLFRNGLSVGSPVDVTSMYHFDSAQGGTPRLFLKNNTAAYTYTVAGGVVQVGDPDFPASTVPGAGYLDGTMYVLTPSGAIYGSAIDNPTSWDPLNKILANSYSDNGVAIIGHLSYIVALKEWSTEVFYDAANPTGSPLSRIDGLKLQYGCAVGESARSSEGDLIWVSKNRSGGVSVVMLDSTLKGHKISSKPIERMLQTADLSVCYSWFIKHDGHRLYGVSFPNSNMTLVYDLMEGIWYYWASDNSPWFHAVGATFSGQSSYFLGPTDGDIYKADSSTYVDENAGITVDIYTPLWDLGTTKAKVCPLMVVVSDKYPTNSVDFRFSDDDYQTWSAFRTIDLSRGVSMATGLGTFRRRAFNFHHASSYPLRIKAVEPQIMLGTL